MIIGYDINEIVYLALACLGGLLSGGLWLFSDLLGSYLYSQAFRKSLRQQAGGKALEIVDGGRLVGVFRLAPVVVLIACLIGGAALLQLVFPIQDFALYRKLVKEVFLWSVAVGFVSGVLIRRQLAKREQKSKGDNDCISVWLLMTVLHAATGLFPPVAQASIAPAGKDSQLVGLNSYLSLSSSMSRLTFATTDSLGRTTRFEQDSKRIGSGTITEIIEPGGRALTIQYGSGGISQITDPLGRTVTYTYEASPSPWGAPRLHTVANPAGGVTTYGYSWTRKGVGSLFLTGRCGAGRSSSCPAALASLLETSPIMYSTAECGNKGVGSLFLTA